MSRQIVGAASARPGTGAIGRVRRAGIGNAWWRSESHRACRARVLEYAGWAVAMHLWFLAVYVVVVSLTPIAIAAQRRWGLLVPAALAVGVAAVDAASLGRPRAVRGLAELLCCAGALLYQLGIAWHERAYWLAAEPVLLAAGSAVRAGAADLARTLSGQHDRRSRPSGAEHRAALAGNGGVRVRAGRIGDRSRAGDQPRAARRMRFSACCREPTPM